jgi:hypothetical protein|tara:strand:- start:161 stop:391 length:231 start_codon:yes stop_codon:yes gene_type:complete
MNFFTVLNMRSQWEELVQTGRGFNLPDLNGTINNIEYFVEEGYKKNRFRKNYKKVMELSKEILGEVYGEETKGSSG